MTSAEQDQIQILLLIGLLLDAKQWGSIEIQPGNLTGENTLAVAYTQFYRATATHIALDGHDSFGVNVGNLTKLTVRKTNTISGTFTIDYLTAGF
ncbi:hypothetical protein [Megamonas hypermegale]|uniref:hypothetical protein n=1 Tax=Megamonas hypermegale TaxID=158847 RepID=UPI0026EE36A7|nr:hypothetical protein [Megamonas hypermegale]